MALFALPAFENGMSLQLVTIVCVVLGVLVLLAPAAAGRYLTLRGSRRRRRLLERWLSHGWPLASDSSNRRSRHD
ncbi:MAG: hypothetical protein ACRD0Q_01835 [Acidimicrobiales bacterium]